MRRRVKTKTMMKLFKSLLACAFMGMLAASDISVNKQFVDFMKKYGKSYKTEAEFEYRFNIFKQSLEILDARRKVGNKTHGITKFSDMTPEEFKQTLTLKTPNQWCQPTSLSFLEDTKVADSLDWRAKGKVSPIKDQGQCGSCWAFSTTGFMESQLLMSNQDLVTFSEQQLVDCDTQYGDNGCNGGLQQNAFNYITDKGIMSDAHYRYSAYRSYCEYKSSEAKHTVKNIKCHENAKVADIKKYLNQVGPMAIALDATDFQYYDSGILECYNDQLDHAVLLVGYGSENGEDYWIVKNSWGQNWGESGFVRVSQKSGSNCAIGVYLVSAEVVSK
jgi:cathepsin L